MDFNSPYNDLNFPHSHKPGQIPLYLGGTVLKYQNDRFPYPFIYRYLKPEKGTPFGCSLPVWPPRGPPRVKAMRFQMPVLENSSNPIKWVVTCLTYGREGEKERQERVVGGTCTESRAANNSRSSDNGRPKFSIVRLNCNLGRTFCPANFLVHHLTIPFTDLIWLSYTLLFRMYLCVYVRPNFPFVWPKGCPSRTYVLSR